LDVTNDSESDLVTALGSVDLDFNILVGIGSGKYGLESQSTVNLNPESLTSPGSNEVDSETDGNTLVGDA